MSDTHETLDQFEEFPKLYRLFREILITEKIDGTNAQVAIDDHGTVRAGSRNRWITPEADNFGFARWVEGNKDELLKLGTGRHFGEWWGQGIQRGYGLKEKRFSLFNVSRWGDDSVRPACCRVVPILYQGDFGHEPVAAAMRVLRDYGSPATAGAFKNPEGIVVFHVPSQHSYKYTLDGDGHKGAK